MKSMHIMFDWLWQQITEVVIFKSNIHLSLSFIYLSMLYGSVVHSRIIILLFQNYMIPCSNLFIFILYDVMIEHSKHSTHSFRNSQLQTDPRSLSDRYILVQLDKVFSVFSYTANTATMFCVPCRRHKVWTWFSVV